MKQDTEEYRVMYREGPQGTPFHTLLVEGFVDGPLDVCKWTKIWKVFSSFSSPEIAISSGFERSLVLILRKTLIDQLETSSQVYAYHGSQRFTTNG